ncbi:ABC transporter permease [Helicobacter cetorum]|uniref:ABC transporter permease n=1 Tax=Helicobacter cetorum TaxID=138563 RepID=UPI000CF0E75E|nr:ABC transporter permease [Helicobacter cetorum]
MNFLSLLLKEFKAFLANKGVLFVVIGGSIMYGMLYPLPYLNDVVANQKIALVDEDNSALSRQFAFMAQSSNSLNIAYKSPSMLEARELLKEEKIYGILHIPYHFEANIYKQIPTTIDFYANANYLLIYGTLATAVVDSVNALNDEIKFKRNAQREEAKLETNIVGIKPIALYNPSEGYLNYALSSVFVFILHQVMLIGASMLTSARRLETISCGKKQIACILSARLVMFMVVLSVFMMLYFGVLFPIHGIERHASALVVFINSAVFMLSTLSLGIFLGTWIKNPAYTTQIVLISSLPLIFMMGFVWPFESLPIGLQVFANMIPAYHGISLLVRLNQMQAEFVDVASHFYALLTIFVVSFVGSVWKLGIIKAQKSTHANA